MEEELKSHGNQDETAVLPGSREYAQLLTEWAYVEKPQGELLDAWKECLRIHLAELSEKGSAKTRDALRAPNYPEMIILQSNIIGGALGIVSTKIFPLFLSPDAALYLTLIGAGVILHFGRTFAYEIQWQIWESKFKTIKVDFPKEGKIPLPNTLRIIFPGGLQKRKNKK